MPYHSLLLNFIKGPVIKNDPVLKSLLQECDLVPGVALVVHNFIKQTNEYMGTYLEMLTGYDRADIIKGGIPMLISMCDPEEIHQLASAQAGFIVLTKSKTFDPRNFCLHAYTWKLNHRLGYKVAASGMGVILTFTEQRDLEFGVGFFLETQSDQNTFEVCKALLRKVKTRHNEIYVHPTREEPISPYPHNYLIDVKHITSREREILGMLARGMSTEEIGKGLGITGNTVETHRRHLLEKFKAKNSAELIKKASKVFWLE